MSIIPRLARNYAVKQLNKALSDRAEGVDRAKAQVSLWLGRVKQIVAALEKALAYLEDNKLDDAEVEEITAAVDKALEERL